MRREDIEGVKPFGFGNQGIWIPKFVNPQLRFMKYSPGQHFKRHRDGGFVINDDLRSVFTIIIYLNHSFSGGETHLYDFQDMDDIPMDSEDIEARKITILPQTGKLLVFNHDFIHEATPILEQSVNAKYILRTDVS